MIKFYFIKFMKQQKMDKEKENVKANECYKC